MADKSKMKCNTPMKSDRAGQEKLIHFGATGYGHNYSTAARSSFRARHKCSEATNKMTANHWACKTLWGGPGKDTQSSPKSRKGKY